MCSLMCLVFIEVFCFCAAKEFYRTDRYVISCHTTDYVCFKRQYKALRDKVLFGNTKYGIDVYEPYMFKYDTNTCIRVTGLEQSWLTGIGLDSITRELTITIDVPFNIQQVANVTTPCAKPKKEFNIQTSEEGPLKGFTGNATIQVSYPYELLRQEDELYLALAQETVEVEIDIPDLSDYDKHNELENTNYNLSEWAYDVVQHIDAAIHVALPYTERIRSVIKQLPLSRLISLYPEEEYVTLRFLFYDSM